MLAKLGKWEIRTNPSEAPGYESIRVCRFEPEPSEAKDLEALAGDFITRHVLERDSTFFEG
jgi:hypothetical protein